MSHPLRREMLRHLGEHGTASSTTLAEALGESTGTTSYHLRVLADAGVIEEVPGQTNGRERWWQTVLVDLREPDYDSLSPQDRAALDEWRASQIPGELALVNRFVREVRKHGNWAKSSRADGYYTADGSRRVLQRLHGPAVQVRPYGQGRTARSAAHAAPHVLHPRRGIRTGGTRKTRRIRFVTSRDCRLANVRVLTISQASNENGRRRPLFTGGAGQVVQTLQRTGGLARDVGHSTDKRSPVKMNDRNFFKRSA